MTRATLFVIGLVACTQEAKVEPLDGAGADDEVTGQEPSSEGGAEEDTASEDQVVEDEEDLPSDYIYEEDEVVALLSPEQVQQGITDGIVAMLSVDPDMLHDTYNTIIDESRSASLGESA